MSPPSPSPAAPSGIVGVILAGGASRRMGADKRTLLLAGRPLLAHVAARLGPQVAALAVAVDRETAARLAAGDAADLAAAMPPGAAMLSDADDTREGPLAGMLAGLRWAAGRGAARVLTVPVDTPLLPTDIGARMAAAVAGDEIAVCATAGRVHHTVALLPPTLAADLAAHLAGDDRRVRGWLARHTVRTVEIPPLTVAGRDLDPLQNLNTPADLAAAEAALSSLMAPR
jgi:molybdopterin-guanine dinucleotide biosynthesis protein A